MARKSKKSSSRSQRDFKTITSAPVLSVYPSTPYLRPSQRKLLAGRLAAPDDRSFHPLRHIRPARLVSGRTASVTYQPVERKKSSVRKFKHPYGPSTHPFKFDLPSQTLVCVRRAVRREVLFASSGGSRPRVSSLKRLTKNSSTSCKRR